MYTNPLQQTPPYYYGYGMQRAPMMNQEQPQIQPQTAPPLMASFAQNFIKGRPVVSIDEARAAQIDLDGSLYVFPDLGNKKIYTKQINMDGTATFNVFDLAVQAPQSAEKQLDYVTKDELNSILEEFKASLTPIPAPKPTPAQPKINL